MTSTLPLDQRITIVLLTYNSAKHIARTLDKLSELGLPIIAVDNASEDTTRSIIGRYPQVRLITLPKNIGAAGRNEGVKHADTPYVVFCDDDTYWEAAGLRYAADMLDSYPRLGLVNGRILVGNTNRLDPISSLMARSPLPDRAGIPGQVLMSFMGGAAVARKEAWLAVGGYDPRFFIGGEEETVGWKLAKAGWEMRYVPEVVVHHFPSLQNAPHLRHYGIRNTLWNAWLHRPARGALHWTWHIISTSPKNLALLKGLLMTLPGLPWVLRQRDVMSPELENNLQILEQQQRKGAAVRRYGSPIKHHRD